VLHFANSGNSTDILDWYIVFQHQCW